MALYIKCSKPSCREYIEKPNRYCEEHSNDTTQTRYNKDRYKYNKEYIKFYNSTPWRKKRNKIKRRDDYICQSCKKKGLIVAGTLVDHIIPTKVSWDKRLDDDNLQLLCEPCHIIKTHEDKTIYNI